MDVPTDVDGRLVAVLEEGQVNGVGHGLISGVVWVKKVTGVVALAESRRMCRVAYRSIEVNHAIEFSTISDGLT